jgi:Ala-tRNA(Pro) deacylase
MQCKERLEEYLRNHGVQFEAQHHRVAYTAQDVAASEHIPGKYLAKVVMVVADGRLVMLALPAPHHVELDRARAALNASEVRLATESELSGAFQDCEVGALPPFGNLYNVPVYVDPYLAEDEWIVYRAGTHTDTHKISYADFERLVHPTTAEIARGHASVGL